MVVTLACSRWKLFCLLCNDKGWKIVFFLIEMLTFKRVRLFTFRSMSTWWGRADCEKGEIGGECLNYWITMTHTHALECAWGYYSIEDNLGAQTCIALTYLNKAKALDEANSNHPNHHHWNVVLHLCACLCMCTCMRVANNKRMMHND